MHRRWHHHIMPEYHTTTIISNSYWIFWHWRDCGLDFSHFFIPFSLFPLVFSTIFYMIPPLIFFFHLLSMCILTKDEGKSLSSRYEMFFLIYSI
ncbi:uncharacterized protein VTP21DRAFT_6010 [Calcarisporiella thermophila]|uniref:uncharacterized protein n=1 Tax=Calcarisporiella thermophila TaxID=911321 RepID=UPI0037431A95